MEVIKVGQRNANFCSTSDLLSNLESVYDCDGSYKLEMDHHHQYHDQTKDETKSPPSCTSCRQIGPLSGNWDKLSVEEDDSETYELGHISIVKCTSCHKFLGILQDKTTFYTAEEILNDKTKTDGWHKIQAIWERRVLFVLSQVVYKDYEEPDKSLMEVEFAFPPPTDLIKILWVNKQAIGFYSVKVKGTLDPTTIPSWYTMTTIDTLFIRQRNRGQGWGSSAIKDLLLDFQQENIGFSFPISIPMSRVLKKYLEVTPSDRNRFWEITGCGTEGCTRNLWLMFQRQSNARIKKSTTTAGYE